MKYDAVILAGGENSSELKKIAPYDNEALIIIGNCPMICYVYSALRGTSVIRNIVVSGPKEALRAILPRDDRLFFVEGGSNAIESFAHAVDFMEGLGISTKVLAVPTDVPFLTSEAIRAFLHTSDSMEADIYYPVIRKEINDQ